MSNKPTRYQMEMLCEESTRGEIMRKSSLLYQEFLEHRRSFERHQDVALRAIIREQIEKVLLKLEVLRQQFPVVRMMEMRIDKWLVQNPVKPIR